MGTHCQRTPDYKVPRGGRKVILWENGVFWGNWEDEFGNHCRPITIGPDARVLRFLVASPHSGTPPLSAVMVVRFHVVAPAEKKRTFTVRLPILLGRSEEAKFRIQHDLVSRRHCELFESQGRVYVRDLGSTNGTYLNDEQVPASTKTVVLPGGVVRVGGLSFAVEYRLQATAVSEHPGLGDGPGVEESRVAGSNESLMEEQPDFQVVHQDEVADQDEAAHQDEKSTAAPSEQAVPTQSVACEAQLGNTATADTDSVPAAEAAEEPTGEPTSPAKQTEGFDFLSDAATTNAPADAPQWPAADAAAADVSDDEQLNNFFKGLT